MFNKVITIDGTKIRSIVDGVSLTLDIDENDQLDIIQRFNKLVKFGEFNLRQTYNNGLYNYTYEAILDTRKKNGIFIPPCKLILNLDPKKKGRRFFRLEGNLLLLSAKGRKDFRNILKKSLKVSNFNKILTNGIITRIDIALDIYNNKPDDFWIDMPKVQKCGIFFGDDGAIETMYLGAIRSKSKVKIYDKFRQLIDNNLLKERVDGMPDNLLRIEISLKSQTNMLNTIKNIDNPFGKIRLFRPFSSHPKIHPCFFDSIRQRGLKPALRVLSECEQRRYRRILKKYKISTLGSFVLWEQWPNTVDLCLYPLYPAKEYNKVIAMKREARILREKLKHGKNKICNLCIDRETQKTGIAKSTRYSKNTKADKFYTVWIGRKPGVYGNWSDAEKQVNGYSDSKYRSFSTRSVAKQAFKDGYEKYI